MQPQRNVSVPLQLHELNLVNKSNTDLLNNDNSTNNNDNITNTTTTPRKLYPSTNNGPRLNIKTKVVSPKRPSTHTAEEEDKLYKLAQKKREINELENRLSQLKKELKIMEQEYTNVNNITGDDDIQPLTTTSQLPAMTNRLKESKFVKSLLTKFNEFNINEDEFDSHVASQNHPEFYLKEGYDLGEDELEREAQEEIGFLEKLNRWGK